MSPTVETCTSPLTPPPSPPPASLPELAATILFQQAAVARRAGAGVAQYSACWTRLFSLSCARLLPASLVSQLASTATGPSLAFLASLASLQSLPPAVLHQLQAAVLQNPAVMEQASSAAIQQVFFPDMFAPDLDLHQLAVSLL